MKRWEEIREWVEERSDNTIDITPKNVLKRWDDIKKWITQYETNNTKIVNKQHDEKNSNDHIMESAHEENDTINGHMHMHLENINSSWTKRLRLTATKKEKVTKRKTSKYRRTDEHSGHKDKKYRIQVSSKKRNISYATERNTKMRKIPRNDHERRPRIHPDACLHIDFHH